MSWTKRQIIDAAVEEIGMASYVFDIEAEEYESALRRLDAMMAEWNANGVRLGYPLSTIDNSSLDQDTGVPDSATEAMIKNLAIRIAPSFDREVTRDTKVVASKSYDTLVMRSLALYPHEKQYPGTLPVGAGNRRYRFRNENFFPRPSDDVEVGPDSILDLN